MPGSQGRTWNSNQLRKMNKSSKNSNGKPGTSSSSYQPLPMTGTPLKHVKADHIRSRQRPSKRTRNDMRDIGPTPPTPSYRMPKVPKTSSTNSSEDKDAKRIDRTRRPMKKERKVQDIVHNLIDLPAVCWEFIDTSQFKRLQKLKQLGMTYRVYPSATHTRFEHSLGVSYLAGKMVDHFIRTQPELNITEEEKTCIMLAGLCHDLGHGPFSHVFESEFMCDYPQKTNWEHEIVSKKMIDELIEANGIDLATYNLSKDDVDFIKELIHPPAESERNPRFAGRSFLYDIVCNTQSGLDVDKLDYFMRDAIHCNIADYRKIVDYVIRSAKVLCTGEGYRICFPRKCHHELFKLFEARYDLHYMVYQHKNTKACELMFADALKLANEYVSIGKQKSISACAYDTKAYTFLNDAVIDIITQKSMEPNLSKQARENLEAATKLFEDMDNRMIYKCCGQIEIDRPQKESELRDAILRMDSGLKESDILLKISSIHYGAKEKNPLEEIYFFQKDSNVAKKLDMSYFKKNGPRSFMTRIVRIYCRTHGKEEVIKRTFAEWALTKIGRPPVKTLSQESEDEA